MKITLVLLSGGRSSRMGRDKAFLKLHNRPVIEGIISGLSPLFDDTLIVANKRRPYESLGVSIMADIIPGKGPLSGIHSGLLNTKTYFNFVVACDMPFINPRLVKYLLRQAHNGCEVIACKIRARYEPLFAIYGKGCIGAVEEQLSGPDTKVTRFFSKVEVKTIAQREVKKIDPDMRSFENINTPYDYQKMTNDKAQNSK